MSSRLPCPIRALLEVLTEYIGGPKILAWPRLHRRFTLVRHSCKQQGALQITEVWKNQDKIRKIVLQKLKQGIKRPPVFFCRFAALLARSS